MRSNLQAKKVSGPANLAHAGSALIFRNESIAFKAQVFGARFVTMTAGCHGRHPSSARRIETTIDRQAGSPAVTACALYSLNVTLI